MSKQVTERRSVNVTELFKGGFGKRKIQSFVIPSFFINFTPEGINIGTVAQQTQTEDTAEVTEPETTSADEKAHRTRGRGRTPGAYVITDKNTQDMNLTSSMQLIHDTLSKRTRGLTALQLSERLDMPMGTVGWALTRMQQRGAVAHAGKRKQRRARKTTQK